MKRMATRLESPPKRGKCDLESITEVSIREDDYFDQGTFDTEEETY
jgi:hypothetical protein